MGEIENGAIYVIMKPRCSFERRKPGGRGSGEGTISIAGIGKIALRFPQSGRRKQIDQISEAELYG